jgi:hypothetical protein
MQQTGRTLEKILVTAQVQYLYKKRSKSNC